MPTLTQTLEERGSRYGEFIDNATTAQLLKHTIRHHKNYGTLDQLHKEALDMILHKIARIMNGDPNYADSWIDIAGYATLVADHIAQQDYLP